MNLFNFRFDSKFLAPLSVFLVQHFLLAHECPLPELARHLYVSQVVAGSSLLAHVRVAECQFFTLLGKHVDPLVASSRVQSHDSPVFELGFHSARSEGSQRGHTFNSALLVNLSLSHPIILASTLFFFERPVNDRFQHLV